MQTYKEPDVPYEIWRKYLSWKASDNDKIAKVRKRKLDRAIARWGLDSAETIATMDRFPNA